MAVTPTRPPQPTPPRPDADDPPWPYADWGLTELIPVTLMPFGITLIATLIPISLGLDGGLVGVILTLIQQLALGLGTVLWVRAHDGSIASLGLRRGATRGSDIGAGIAAGLGAIAAGGIVIGLTIQVVEAVTGDPQEIENVLESFGDSWVVVSAAIALLLAPICEEILFRGFLFGGLRGRLPFWQAAVISSALFGLVHADGLRFLGLAVEGFIMAAAYERRRTLVAAMVAHATVNSVAIIALFASR